MAISIGNKPIYRMSSAGKCPRALCAGRLGYEAEPAPPWLEMAANEGNWHEDRIKNQLREEGFEVFDEQLEISLEYDKFILLGHIDGKVLEGMEEQYSIGTLLLEVKSMSQYQFDRWMKQGFDGFYDYAAQLTCYMKATGLDKALYIVKNRSSGYESRIVIQKPPARLDDIIAKLDNIEDWIDKNIEPGVREELYPAEFNPNSLECKRCDYKQYCAPDIEELLAVDELNLNNAVSKFREGKKAEATGQELINEARDTFEQHTLATGIDKWRFSGLGISLIHVHRESYSKKLLEATVPAHLLEPSKEIKDYDQLRIDDLEKEN